MGGEGVLSGAWVPALPQTPPSTWSTISECPAGRIALLPGRRQIPAWRMGAYFAFGWPKAFFTGLPVESGDGTHALYASLNTDYLIVVYPAAVQMWSAGQHRVKLGEVIRKQEDVEEQGANMRAHWCPTRKLLAVVVSAAAPLPPVCPVHCCPPPPQHPAHSVHISCPSPARACRPTRATFSCTRCTSART